MPVTFRLGRESLDLPAVALTYALGIAGGLAAMALHLPLPMLLGSLLAVGGAAIGGLRPLGQPVQAPQAMRMLFVPVIGIAIGASFTPGILSDARIWWISLATLLVFLPAAHLVVFVLFSRLGRIDRTTAWYGAAPGGMIENVHMGEEAGADVAMLTMLQFQRLILVVVAVPLIFSIIEGHAVGSAGGAAVPGTGAALSWLDVVLLTLAGVAGAVAGVKLRLPAGHISGPILLSAVLHLTGLTETAPPQTLVWAAQVVIGTALGVRFAGMARGAVLRALGLSVLNVGLVGTAALSLAWIATPLFDEPLLAVFLAFAPGGLVEMGLIALSLNLSVAYVTLHHILRIIWSVAVSRALGGRMTRG